MKKKYKEPKFKFYVLSKEVMLIESTEQFIDMDKFDEYISNTFTG